VRNYANFSPRKHRGAGVIDVLLGTFLVALFIGGIAYWMRHSAATTRTTIAATQAVAIREAALSFQRANQGAILAATGPTTPYTRTLAQLQAANAIPANFNGVNPYGQTYVVSWVQPSSGLLAPVVLTTGGAAIADGELGDIANEISAQGGEGAYISSAAPTQITCAQGTCNPIALSTYGFGALGGHYAIAMFKGVQTSTDDFLHRHNDGNPAHAQMSQAIDMQGNAVNNVADVHTQAAGQGVTFFGGGEKIVGSADYGISFLTNNGSERMRIYNDGHVGLNSYVTLPGGNGLSIGGSWYYGDGSNLALRPAANGGTVYIQGTASGGGTANLYATGNITSAGASYSSNWFRSQGASGWYSESYGGGIYMSDASYVRVYGDKNFYTGGQIQGGSVQSNSTITAASRITSGEYMLPQGGANIGWGCSPNGLLGRDAGGTQVVQCKNGVWSTLGGWSQFTIVTGPTAYGFNNSIATCPGGWTALSAGFTVPGQPYKTMPGVGSVRLINTTQALAVSTDNNVPVQAIVYCGS